MNENKISVRYAKALFSLTKEENSLDVHQKDIELLLQCIHDIPELVYVIESPVLRSAEKIRLFKESFKDSFQPLTLTFINLVLKHRREEYLAGVCRFYLDLIKAEKGIRTANLITATPVDESLRQSIVQLIAHKFNTKVELHEQVDAGIVGGFILRVEDQQIDASISNKLKRIKNELINSHS